MDISPIVAYILMGICLYIVIFLITVLIVRWVFRVNDIANALQELAYYKKIELNASQNQDYYEE
ncbi:hypothetical protein OfM1_02680 [Lactovum odontotermitis]